MNPADALVLLSLLQSNVCRLGNDPTGGIGRAVIICPAGEVPLNERVNRPARLPLTGSLSPMRPGLLDHT